MKKFLIISFCFFLFGCSIEQENNLVNEPKELKVYSSIIPLASIASFIGGEYIDSNNAIPAGVSPHGYDLKVSVVNEIVKSDLFIYTGLEGVDDYFDKIISNDKLFNVSENIYIEKNEKIYLSEYEKEEEHKHEHLFNPHIWLSYKNAKIIGNEIAKKLAKAIPNNEIYILENLNKFEKEIDNQIDFFNRNTAGKTQKHFIVFHDAYTYLFDELGINEENKTVFQNISGDMNVSYMKELEDKIDKYNIKIIFIEPQFNSKEVLDYAKSHGLTVLTLDPLGQDINNEGYLNNMKNNLEQLIKIYE